MSTSFGDGSSRKRARESSSTIPPLLSAWEDDPDFGLIHSSGCDVCVSYMAHLAEASYSDNQPSFQIALSDRNHKREVSFYEGVTEGRRRQRSDNESLIDDLERYRAERNEALDAVGRYRLERNDAREETEYFRAKFDASKVECERLKQRVAQLSKEKRNDVFDVEALEMEQIPVDPENSPLVTTQTSLTSSLSTTSSQGPGRVPVSASISTATQLNSTSGHPPASTQNVPQDLPSFTSSTLNGTIDVTTFGGPGQSAISASGRGGSSISVAQPSAVLVRSPRGTSSPSEASIIFKQSMSDGRPLTVTTPAFGSLGNPKRSAAASHASGKSPIAANEPVPKSPHAMTSPALPSTYAAAAKDRCGIMPPVSADSRSVLSADKHVASSTWPVSLSLRPPAAGPSAILNQSIAPVSRSGLPKNIRQLQSLMNAAHQPGNLGALKKVKGLCADAHQTPKEQKTDLQRYLLANWRNPISVAGESALPPTPVPKTNPRLDDPIELWVAYLSAHRGSWPRGVRRDSQGQPRVLDLKASRMVARLRPDVESTTSSVPARYGFMTLVIQIFSEYGLYEELLQRNGFRIASEITFRRYSGPLDEISHDQVARHFADCGVTLQMATHELGPWAREYHTAAPQAVCEGEKQPAR